MLKVSLSKTESRAIFTLSTIMALRMIGLFMVLPLFTLYATHLKGATPFLIGVAMGIYGLFQAIFQIPFGSLSDKYGRKKIITIGLTIFAVGSFVAGIAHTMTLMIIGRALQGMGAVGSTLLALLADLTREDQRTKAMAIAGITIGFAFSIAMVAGPLFSKWLPINSLFFVSMLLGFAAITLLYTSVPNPQTTTWHRDTEPELKAFFNLLISPDLAKLNLGILILHAIFTASFIVIPISLDKFAGYSADRQWLLYLPTLIAAFILTMFCIGLAESKQQLKPYFLLGIIAMGMAEVFIWLQPSNFLAVTSGLCLFFTGFSLLEAFLPSLISRTAPASRKGTALGIYSCSQFFGIFIGGVLGGWLYGVYSFTGVYVFCLTLALFWLLIASFMQPPRFYVSRMWKISLQQQSAWPTIAKALQSIPGMVEATFIPEDGIAYLKMERSTPKHPDFIRLKEQLQSE